MEQDCSLFYRYRSASSSTPTEQHHAHADDETEGVAGEVEEAVVVYTPLVGDVSHPKMDVFDAAAVAMGQTPPSEAYIPFYHPKVRALAFHYQPTTFRPSNSDVGHDDDDDPIFGRMAISLIPFPPSSVFPPTHRLSRVGLSLLTTLHMHTWGDMHSYQKRVHHDTIIPRSLYQDLYLSLKGKYASELIAGWKEATDPAKHVFEEMGIAAYLIGP